MHISWTLYSFQIQVSTLCGTLSSFHDGESQYDNADADTHEGSRHPSDPTHYG